MKAHADVEGDGFTVYIPSLKRERQTLAGRLRLLDAEVVKGNNSLRQKARVGQGGSMEQSDPQSDPTAQQLAVDAAE